MGCDGNRFSRADHPPVTVEFSGRVVDAETGDPVGNVRVSLDAVKFSSEVGFNIQPAGWVLPTDSVTSGGDGTFTLVLNVPRNWLSVDVKLTDPGYDEMRRSFDHRTAGTRAEIRMYQALGDDQLKMIFVQGLDCEVWQFCHGPPTRRVFMCRPRCSQSF